MEDPTDWINTPLKAFSDLEASLHCQICKEFYDTPMITSCSHTFCSKCIRTSLSSDGKCPACRTADQANKLRNNWALQEVVATFLEARPAALEVARRDQEVTAQSKRPGKRKRAIVDSDDVAQAEQDTRTTRSKSRRLRASQTSQSESIEILDSDGESEYAPEQHEDGLVECPLGCGKRMKIEAVEPHLDRCEDEQQESTRAKSQTPANTLRTLRPPSDQGNKPQDRLSELNYSLLTESKLGKKLNELGIPNLGSKQLMVKRHTVWVNLWNANCDSNHPRSKRELLHDLDVWERTQGSKASNVNGVASTVMRKDFDGIGWAKKNKDDFSWLIAEAKRKRQSPDTEQDRPKEASGDDLATDAESRTTSPHFGDIARSTIDGISYGDDVTSSKPQEAEAANECGTPIPVDRGFEDPTERPAVPDALSWSALEAGNQPPDPNAPVSLDHEKVGLSSMHSTSEYPPTSVNGLHNDAVSAAPSPPARKMPMFAVPQQAVSHVDSGGLDGS